MKSGAAAGTKSTTTKVVRVPRKQLQRVDDLLARGYEGDSQAETAKEKFVWLFVIMVLFYISFEIFNHAFGIRDAPDGMVRPRLKNPLVKWMKTGKLFGDEEF
jgi:hypothetical protein